MYSIQPYTCTAISSVNAPMSRSVAIRHKLTEALSATRVLIKDESHNHRVCSLLC